LAGDGRYAVLNRNVGITNSNYFDRARYSATFHDIFEELRADGMFERRLREIENTDCSSSHRSRRWTHDQSIAVEDILMASSTT
jgi:hypothetical protein